MRPMSYQTLPDFYWGWLSNVNFNTLKTRMHSNRMRTFRSSGHREGGGVSQHALSSGVSAPVHAGIHIPPCGQNDRHL